MGHNDPHPWNNVIPDPMGNRVNILNQNHFQDDKVSIFPRKLAPNFENAVFLLARHYFNLQDINTSFEYVDFHAKR